jgi:hypothetical protein
LLDDFGKIRGVAMGGAGSGRRYRWDTKTTVEACHSIDVRRWHRDGLLKPGHWFAWKWSRNGEERASIGVQVHDDRVELSYTSRAGTEELRQLRYAVSLDRTACTYGGQRPWFICSGVVNGRACGRRVAKLSLGGAYFLCRHCYDLTYESRCEGPMDRARSRSQAIRVRLGGSASLFEPLPPKPKGMHWRTYDRLCRRAVEADEESWRGLQAWLDRVDARIDRIIQRPS